MKLKSGVFFRRTLALVLSGVILTSLLSAVLYIFISRRIFIDIRSDELTPVARSISSFISESEDKSASSLGSTFFFRAIANENTNFVDATVYALDADGELLIYSNNSYNSGPPFLRPDHGPGGHGSVYFQNNDSEVYSSDGDSTVISSESDFSKDPKPSPTPPLETATGDDTPVDLLIIKDSFVSVRDSGELTTTAKSQTDSKEYLVVGVPIVDGEGNFDGAVIITKPVDQLSEKLQGLDITLVVSAVLSCIIMVFPAYIIGKKLTNPLRDIQGVAQSMSMGDFSKRADEHQAGEIGELALAINEFAEKSETLEQTRRDYVANISHELRTPIASIRAMSETLRDGLLTEDDKKQRYYDHILRESMRLARLVDDLLELSRLQSRGVALKRENTDLLPILDASATIFEQTAADAGVDFHFDRPDRLPMTMTNADRIEQILVILIDNAIKHTPDDGTVTLSVDVEEDLLKITVSDTGEGIGESDISHVFERFYKSDKSHSGSGTGLGLSIAKEVLDMMGETISVVSELGKGSAFTFTVHLTK